VTRPAAGRQQCDAGDEGPDLEREHHGAFGRAHADRRVRPPRRDGQQREPGHPDQAEHRRGAARHRVAPRGRRRPGDQERDVAHDEAGQRARGVDRAVHVLGDEPDDDPGHARGDDQALPHPAAAARRPRPGREDGAGGEQDALQHERRVHDRVQRRADGVAGRAGHRAQVADVVRRPAVRGGPRALDDDVRDDELRGPEDQQNGADPGPEGAPAGDGHARGSHPPGRGGGVSPRWTAGPHPRLDLPAAATLGAWEPSSSSPPHC
jgi:hypothetical protein